MFVSIDDGGLESETKLARLLDSGASDNFVVPTGFQTSLNTFVTQFYKTVNVRKLLKFYFIGFMLSIGTDEWACQVLAS